MRLDRDSELRGGGGAIGTCPGSSSMAAAYGERGPQLEGAEARRGEARRGAGRGARAQRRRPPASTCEALRGAGRGAACLRRAARG